MEDMANKYRKLCLKINVLKEVRELIDDKRQWGWEDRVEIYNEGIYDSMKIIDEKIGDFNRLLQKLDIEEDE